MSSYTTQDVRFTGEYNSESKKGGKTQQNCAWKVLLRPINVVSTKTHILTNQDCKLNNTNSTVYQL